VRRLTILVPLGLYLLALVVRLVAANEMPVPTTEPSLYYVDVAQNLLAGHGLVSDGVWSYATEPLVVPKPAFELWLPMATFVGAAAMSVLGSGFWAAQVGMAILGAAVAPLAWLIGREAARTQGLDVRRGGAVAITAGLLAAVLSPLVLGSAVPDSYTPFTVFMLAAAALVPRALGLRDGQDSGVPPTRLAGLGLGLAMGCAYLSRQETVWLGLTFVIMLTWTLRARPPGRRLREGARRLWPVVAGGLLVVVPWLARNAIELGSPLPGQVTLNMFLVENEDIFAFARQPDAATYLAQGPATVLLNPLRAALDGLLGVLLLPPFPVGLIGLASLVALRRAPALRRPTALLTLLISGGLTFATTMLLFPVATLWGTFMHASGPLLVGLAVVAALGGDALLARISALRHWEKPNVVIAPIALVGMAAVMTTFQVLVFAEQSRRNESLYAAVGTALERSAAELGLPRPATVISDHPMWLAETTGDFAIALPDEGLDSIGRLAGIFEAPWVVVIDERGRYPAALLAEDAQSCLAVDPVPLAVDGTEAWLFVLDDACVLA
jgi:hypothetical protein